MDSKTGQQHKIMRQVLEVRGCAHADARRVQSDIRDAYYRRLLPSIERTCSELSTPGRIQRVGLLEIDLGEVPPDAFESAVADKFDRVFAARLAAAIGFAESTQVDADLELFSYFIRTGTVPWWADRSDRRLLETRLETSIRRAPRAFRRAIERAPDQKAVCRRIALAYPDRLLDELLGVLAVPLTAAYPGLGTHWLAMIEIVASGQGYPTSVARTLWWEEILRASQDGDAPVSEAPRFFEAILIRLARRLGLEYSSLVADLHRTLDQVDLPVQPWARDVVESLHQNALEARGRYLASHPDGGQPDGDQGVSGGAVGVHAGPAGSGSAGEALERLLAQCEPPGRLDDDVWPRLRVLIARLPSGERVRALARIRRTPEGAALLREFDAPSDSRRQDDLAFERNSDKSEARSPVELGFSDVDEIYVENAGLVILWPFLENFFVHLGLIEEKQFRDSVARQRAVGLLQYVAAEEAAAPEYLVPLNKVLCGMPLDEVFDFGPAITDAEIEACTDLLAAAIHHAPILRDMSVQGFRGSFLLRQGQLSVRDGTWLLRVERETYDIVLDRFPWSVTIVKLPWMAAIMPVEW